MAEDTGLFRIGVALAIGRVEASCELERGGDGNCELLGKDAEDDDDDRLVTGAVGGRGLNGVGERTSGAEVTDRESNSGPRGASADCGADESDVSGGDSKGEFTHGTSNSGPPGAPTDCGGDDESDGADTGGDIFGLWQSHAERGGALGSGGGAHTGRDVFGWWLSHAERGGALGSGGGGKGGGRGGGGREKGTRNSSGMPEIVNSQNCARSSKLGTTWRPREQRFEPWSNVRIGSSATWFST